MSNEGKFTPSGLITTGADEARQIIAEAARYRAWRDGDVIVRGGPSQGWEAKWHEDPHWDVGSWVWSESLDEAIDGAVRNGHK